MNEDPVICIKHNKVIKCPSLHKGVGFMIDTNAIKKLSREEKLQVMEAIWEDLSVDEETIESPVWHQEALKESGQRRVAGRENILDWKDAKKELRKRFE
jgi:hypothetical protein